jgi:anti-sigma regulatory factor (Ser/Thr protein kinase)
MKDISLHLLDIIENSVRAKADQISIDIIIEVMRNKLLLRIKDNGIGMDQKTLLKAVDPFYTSKNERVKKIGLGIPLLKQNAEMCGGSFKLLSSPGKGTDLSAEFKFDHVDRMPLGNIADTMISVVIGHPETDFQLNLKRKLINGEIRDYEFSTSFLKKELGNVPLSYPDVIQLIEKDINEGIKKTQMEEF